MATQISIDQIKGIPQPTDSEINKILVYKGSEIFEFEDKDSAAVVAQVNTLETRVTTLEGAAVTTVDGGEY